MSATTKQPRPTRDASGIHSGKRLLDAKRLCDFLSISEDSLAKLIDDPDEQFPAPLEILGGKRPHRHWTLESIERYVERKARAANKNDRR